MRQIFTTIIPTFALMFTSVESVVPGIPLSATEQREIMNDMLRLAAEDGTSLTRRDIQDYSSIIAEMNWSPEEVADLMETQTDALLASIDAENIIIDYLMSTDQMDLLRLTPEDEADVMNEFRALTTV